jgi:hypothetical protein
MDPAGRKEEKRRKKGGRKGGRERGTFLVCGCYYSGIEIIGANSPCLPAGCLWQKSPPTNQQRVCVYTCWWELMLEKGPKPEEKKSGAGLPRGNNRLVYLIIHPIERINIRPIANRLPNLQEGRERGREEQRER